MVNEIRRTPEEWAKRIGVTILDPDGWDRSNFEESWSTPLTESEFRLRASLSTAYWGRGA